MSESNDDFKKKVEEAAEEERRKKSVLSKELSVRERRAENEIDRIEKNDRELAVINETNFGLTTEEEIAQIQKDNQEYIEAARHKMKFINDEFEGRIPYFRKNLILIGGKTGDGKSTTVANIVYTTISQINPATGKRCRALVISNEERREDVFNRITCLIKGWHYTNHSKFTDEQTDIFNKSIAGLARGSLVKVIDDNHGSTDTQAVNGVTTTLEGIQGIFDNLLANNEHFDVILIDYYQNIKMSKKNPHLNEWEVQAQLAAMLDKYKNIYPGPIILLAQVTPPDENKSVPFKQRIEGRKVILNVATCCVEMVADRDNLRTEWTVHKSRFNEFVGKHCFTGYDNGKYVTWEENKEFQAKVQKIKEERSKSEFDKQIGHMPTGEENGQSGQPKSE